MDNKQLAKEIALGIINTGIEGDYNCVVKSTGYDYPSIGVSQWEGQRANNLLSWIDGGKKFMSRSYYDICLAGELQELKELLDSEQGHIAQQEVLAYDCQDYIDILSQVPELKNPACIVYAGMWCPTSMYCVATFLSGFITYDLNDLVILAYLFQTKYAKYAEIDKDLYEGYSNRAIATFDYVSKLNL